MTAEQAKQIISDTVIKAAELCKEKGFVSSARAYYSDKAFRECTEFNDSVILIFGAIKIGVADMDDEDMCTYGLCCETKLGTVKDEELEREISEFKTNLDKMIEEILAAPSPEKKIAEINEKQEQEASDSMKAFDLEMKKMKLKLYTALGIFAAFAAALIILGFVL